MNLRYAALGAALLCATALYGQDKKTDNSNSIIPLNGDITKNNEKAYDEQNEEKLGEIEYLIYDAQNKLFRGTSYYKGAYYLDTRRTLRFIVRDYNSLRYFIALNIDTLRLFPISNTTFNSFLTAIDNLDFISIRSITANFSDTECTELNNIGLKIEDIHSKINNQIAEINIILEFSRSISNIHASAAQNFLNPKEVNSQADAVIKKYTKGKYKTLEELPGDYLNTEYITLDNSLLNSYIIFDTLSNYFEKFSNKIDFNKKICGYQLEQIANDIEKIKKSQIKYEKNKSTNIEVTQRYQVMLHELKAGLIQSSKTFPPIVSDNQDGMQLTLLMYDRYPTQVGDKKLNAIEAIDIPIIYYNQFKLDFSTGLFVGVLEGLSRDQRFELRATGDTARVRYLSNGVSRDTTIAQLGVSKVQESNLVIGPMAFLHAYHKWRNVSVGGHLGLGARLNQVDRLRPIYAIGASVMFGRYQRAVFNLSYFWTPVTRLADNEKEGVIYDLLDNGARPLLRTPTPTQVNTQQIMGSGVGFSFSWNLTTQTKFKRYKPEPEAPPKPNASGSDAEGSKPPKFKTTGKKVKTQNNTETVEDQVPDK